MRSVGEVLVPDFLVARLTNIGLGVLAAGRARERRRCRSIRCGGVFLRWKGGGQAPSYEEGRQKRDRSTAHESHPWLLNKLFAGWSTT